MIGRLVRANTLEVVDPSADPESRSLKYFPGFRLTNFSAAVAVAFVRFRERKTNTYHGLD